MRNYHLSAVSLTGKGALIIALVPLMVLSVAPGLVHPVAAVCVFSGADFTIEADPFALTLTTGSTGTSTITLSSLDGFVGTVALSPSAAPGLTASASPDTVDLTLGGTETSILNISTDLTTTPGSYTLTLDGSSGPLFHSTFLFVEVLGTDFTISASPSSLEISAGVPGSSDIILTSVGGFADTISLDASVFPSGPTLSLTPSSIDLAVDETKTSTLAIDVSGVSPGTYYLVVTGTSGSLSHSETVYVTVTGADFSILPDSFLLTIPAGTSGTYTITVTSLSSFAGTVSLSADAFPPLPTPSFSPMTVTLAADETNSSEMTVTVDLSTAPDFYPVHITASSDGIIHEADVIVDVPPPGFSISASPSPPSSLTIEPGSSGMFTITLTSVLGFSGIVTLSATTLDPCLDLTLDPDTVPLPAGGTASSSLKVDVHPLTPSGDYTVVVDGTSDSLSDFTIAFVTVGSVDSSPPTWPTETSLTATKTGSSHATLSWTPATDDVGVASYLIYEGSDPVAVVPASTTSYTVSGLTAETSYTFKVEAVDAVGNTSTDGPSLTVTTAPAPPTNDPPVLSAISDKIIDEGSLLTFPAAATDPNGDSPAFSLGPGAPSGASITPGGVFTWTPTEEQGPGTYFVTVIVSDGSAIDSKTFQVTVNEVNIAPNLATVGPKEASEETALTFTVTATDSDTGQTLTLISTGLPTGASFSSTPALGTVTGTFTWTPSEAQGPGVFTIDFTVLDGDPDSDYNDLAWDSETVTVTVAEVNTAPVLAALVDRTAQEGVLLSLTANAADADFPANTLAYSLAAGAPPGASITSAGVFSWTPNASQGPGTYTVTVVVSDELSSDSKTFTVTVTEPQRAPSAPASFWEQYWYVIAAAILVIIAIPVLWKVRKGSSTKAV